MSDKFDSRGNQHVGLVRAPGATEPPTPASPARTTGEEREALRASSEYTREHGERYARGRAKEILRVLADLDRLTAERDELEADRDKARADEQAALDAFQVRSREANEARAALSAAEARATAAEGERDRAVGLLGEAEQRITDPLRFDGSHGFSSVVRVFLASLSPATATPGEPGKGPTACEHCGLAGSMCLCHEEVTP